MRIPLQMPNWLRFLKKGRDLVGIDVGTYAVKIVHLKGMPGSWSLARWDVIPYDHLESLEASLVDLRSQAVASLQGYLKSKPIPVNHAATSISGNSVIVRYVKMAKTSHEELSKSIKFEAEPYIPFNIEEVHLGFAILGDVFEEGQTQMETVLVAAKKEAVDLRVDLLREAGLEPAILDVDAFALENAYEVLFPLPQSETVLFMNIGASSTNISIVEKGISRVVRDVAIAGNSFTKAIQAQFQCDLKTAEQKKILYGLREDSAAGGDRPVDESRKAEPRQGRDAEPEAQQIVELLLPVARDLLTEVQRSIDFYLSQGSDRAVHRIFLCGGSAPLKDLDKFISREMKMAVEIFNPLALLPNAPTDLTEEQKSMLPQMAVAVGLATRREGDSIG